MTLIDKLNTINTSTISKLENGGANSIEEFWDTFIKKKLPKREVVLQWHNILLKYIKQPNAVFAIRVYNTAPREKYNTLRRGFLSKTGEGYSFFYTDNFHAAYYLKMVLDGYVPNNVEELVLAYNSRKFPSRFGPITSEEKELMSVPQGKDPGIQNAGYKIAHIINVGKDYYDENQDKTLSSIIEDFFPRGNRNDWKITKDNLGIYYLRNFDVSTKAKKYLIAEFLRFVHPFNYFLTPKKDKHYSVVANDIAEYQPLIDYVQKKYTEIYGDAYNEYLKLIMVNSDKKYKSLSELGKKQISLKYGITNTENKSINNNFLKNKSLNKLSVNYIQTQISNSEDLDFDMIKEYLNNPNTSFRKLEKAYMHIESPVRGGGFKAKKIINAYGISAEKKGILSKIPIDLEIQKSTGEYKKTLLILKNRFDL